MGRNTHRCKVKECGARVYLLPLENGEIAVDLATVDVVTQKEETLFEVVRGYRPHRYTCVDIAHRHRSEGVQE